MRPTLDTAGPVDAPAAHAGRGATDAVADVRRIAHDPDAFEAFYREHIGAVQRFVARRVADRELAADLTADVFLAAIDSASSYRPGRGTPAAWLYGVARLVVAAEWRRRGRERRATHRLLGRELLHQDDAARIDARIDAEAESRRLYEAVRQLPERLRAVLELVALDELSVAEAAGALQISPLAARVRLHRARRRLAQGLGESPQRPGEGNGHNPQPQEASL